MAGKVTRSEVLCLVLALLAAVGCGQGGSRDAGGAPVGKQAEVLRVHVVNYPLQYFAERIGGDRVRVEFPAPPDVDPAFWRPTAEQVGGYQKADLVLLSGAGYAKWVDTASLPSASLVDTSASYRDRLIQAESVTTHSHGPEGEHEHGGLAFTTWLDFRLAVEQARAIEAAFQQALPAGAETFRAGLEGLEQDLLELDQALRQTVEGRSMPLLGSHPVYQYLARGYGLEIESVHFEPHEFPDEAAWRKLQELLDDHPASWMLWEATPLARSADRLRELGVGSFVFDPCGNRPQQGDFLTVQRSNLDNLRRIFGSDS